MQDFIRTIMDREKNILIRINFINTNLNSIPNLPNLAFNYLYFYLIIKKK